MIGFFGPSRAASQQQQPRHNKIRKSGAAQQKSRFTFSPCRQTGRACMRNIFCRVFGFAEMLVPFTLHPYQLDHLHHHQWNERNFYAQLEWTFTAAGDLRLMNWYKLSNKSDARISNGRDAKCVTIGGLLRRWRRMENWISHGNCGKIIHLTWPFESALLHKHSTDSLSALFSPIPAFHFSCLCGTF